MIAVIIRWARGLRDFPLTPHHHGVRHIGSPTKQNKPVLRPPAKQMPIPSSPWPSTWSVESLKRLIPPKKEEILPLDSRLQHHLFPGSPVYHADFGHASPHSCVSQFLKLTLSLFLSVSLFHSIYHSIYHLSPIHSLLVLFLTNTVTEVDTEEIGQNNIPEILLVFYVPITSPFCPSLKPRCSVLTALQQM